LLLLLCCWLGPWTRWLVAAVGVVAVYDLGHLLLLLLLLLMTSVLWEQRELPLQLLLLLLLYLQCPH
jgi:hypothetical protein